MCRPVPCRACGRTTWAGCGRHVAAVEATVPTGQWCGGHDEVPRRGVLRRLLGR